MVVQDGAGGMSSSGTMLAILNALRPGSSRGSPLGLQIQKLEVEMKASHQFGGEPHTNAKRARLVEEQRGEMRRRRQEARQQRHTA